MIKSCLITIKCPRDTATLNRIISLFRKRSIQVDQMYFFRKDKDYNAFELQFKCDEDKFENLKLNLKKIIGVVTVRGFTYT